MKGPKVGSVLYEDSKQLLKESPDVIRMLEIVGKGGLKQLVEQDLVSVNVTINPSLQEYMDVKEESMKDINNFFEELKQGRGWDFLDFGIIFIPMQSFDSRVGMEVKYSVPAGLDLTLPICYTEYGSAGRDSSIYCALETAKSKYSQYGQAFNEKINSLFEYRCNIFKFRHRKKSDYVYVSDDIFYRFHLRNFYSYLMILFEDLTLDNLFERITILIASDNTMIRVIAKEIISSEQKYKKAINSKIIRDHFKE